MADLKEKNLLAYIKQNPFFLAPMAGVTDKPFRSFMREMGCGIITSELVSARALKDNNARTLQLADFSKGQKPFGIQIFGEDFNMIAEGAKKAESMGADFIDLNLGCPVRKIVNKGAGSALLKDLKTLARLLRSLRSAVQIPLSLKTRTGWDEQSRNADQLACIAYEEGFLWMSVHGRTRAQGYSGHADWAYIKKIKAKAKLPIIGNGDIKSGAQADTALKQSACDGVMIGRGCLNDPWIFIEALSLFKARQNDFSLNGDSLKDSENKPIKEPYFKGAFDKSNSALALRLKQNNKEFLKEKGPADLFALNKTVDEKSCSLGSAAPLSAGVDLPLNEKDSCHNPSLIVKKDFQAVLNKLKTHLENFYDERMFIIQMKKFAAWLSSGFPHSTEFRKTVFQEKDRTALLEKINCFFENAQEKPSLQPKAYEPFLMQGHG